jgi:hypothetical protein
MPHERVPRRIAFEQLVHDVRYAWRGLWKSRTFAATTVLTLAVGLALVTVVFTIFDAYVLRPFAVRDPYTLHVIGWEAKDAQGWRFSLPEFEELKGRIDLFDDVSAERTQFVLSGTRQLYAGFVSGNYFDMLGARVSQGRALADFDVAAGGNAVAVLSDEAWAFEALPLSEVLALQMFPLRIASWIGAVLGAIAIVLSVSGLYGVLTYTLSARTREIGIRMALGATSGRVLRLVMLQCVRLSAWGVAAGLAVAFAAMKILSSAIQMRNVSVVDAGALAVATGVVAAAAALAAYFPARRATRIIPSQALRADL